VQSRDPTALDEPCHRRGIAQNPHSFCMIASMEPSAPSPAPTDQRVTKNYPNDGSRHLLTFGPGMPATETFIAGKQEGRVGWGADTRVGLLHTAECLGSGNRKVAEQFSGTPRAVAAAVCEAATKCHDILG
jgi:hypothetical protein